MTFSHLNRRVHLYLGLALLPWFFMYGISSLPFAHNQFFERRDAAKGLPMREGTIVDATLIAAPPSTENRDKQRDSRCIKSRRATSGTSA